MRTHPSWLALYGGVAVLALTLAISGSLQPVGRSFPGFVVWDNGTIVSFSGADWTGPEAGVGRGRIVAIDGRPFEGVVPFLEHAAQAGPETPIHYRVLDAGILRSVVVPTMSFSTWDYATTFGNYLLGSISLLAIGLLALALGGDRPAGRGLAFAAGSTGLLLALVVDYLTTARGVVACQLVEALCPVALMNLAFVFPVERVSTRRRRSFVAALATVLLLHGAATAWLFRAQPETALSFILFTYVAMIVSLIGFVASLIHALLYAREARVRLQAAVVAAGALPAILALAIPTLGFALLGWQVSATWSTLLLPILPLAILYAIIRLDMLTAERFVRWSVGYGVATVAVVTAYVVGVAFLERLVLTGSGARPATQFVLLLVMALTFEPIRRNAQTWVGRVFFRFEVDVGEALEASSVELGGLADEERVRQVVARRVQETLGLEWSAVEDDERVGACAFSAPIVFDGEELAVLRCGGKRSGAPYSSEEHELVRGIAGQAALAIQNARMFQALRSAQEEKIRAERLATIGEFTRAVAHGIRNPLSAVRAAAQRAADPSSRSDLDETLRSIVSETDRVDHRIRALLEFSRTREARLSEVDLGVVLDRVADAMDQACERAGVELSVLSTERVVAVVDPDVLLEVILELCMNALLAMKPDGGRLTLELEKHGSEARIRVSDTGKGVPEPIEDRVFDLFFSGRPGGVGLGLATARRLIEMMGGQIILVTGSGAGAEFEIRLPLGLPGQSGLAVEPS